MRKKKEEVLSRTSSSKIFHSLARAGASPRSVQVVREGVSNAVSRSVMVQMLPLRVDCSSAQSYPSKLGCDIRLTNN